MIDIQSYQLSDIKININSDTILSISNNVLYKKFVIPFNTADATCSFFELKRESFILNALDAKEKSALLRTVVFPERWATNPVFRSPLVREAIQPCFSEPELFHLSLSWNRLIIRDFIKNRFYYFYFPETKATMSHPMFAARFRNFISMSLVNLNGFLLHGAGALTPNGASLFLAPDEGGKTTLIKKFDPSRILSDDQIVLRFRADRFFLSSTPFGTLTCGPAESELGAIFLIRKSRKFELLPAKRNDILRFLWKDNFFKTIVLPNVLRSRAFDLLYQVCHQIPSYYLHAPIDLLDFNAIHRAME